MRHPRALERGHRPAEELHASAREQGTSFKEALNTAVRLGLAHDRGASEPYRMPTRRLGLRHGVDLDQALRLAGELEDAELELRK